MQSANINIEDKLSILSGPSEDVGVAALSIKDVDNGVTLLDDTLTDEELAFLSGAFLKRTSEYILFMFGTFSLFFRSRCSNV